MAKLATIWTATLLLLGSDFGQDQPEYRVKAFFLSNLASRNNIQWPDTAFPKKDAPFRIGILGKDPMGAELEAALGKSRPQGRTVEIVRTRTINDLKTCHLVFVPATERRRTPAVLDEVQGQATLVVGESDGFAKAGGGINFYLSRDGKIRLELNPDALSRVGLSTRARFRQTVEKHGRIVREEE